MKIWLTITLSFRTICKMGNNQFPFFLAFVHLDLFFYSACLFYIYFFLWNESDFILTVASSHCVEKYIFSMRIHRGKLTVTSPHHSNILHKKFKSTAKWCSYIMKKMKGNNVNLILPIDIAVSAQTHWKKSGVGA